MSLLKTAMLERDEAHGFLLDGFPREMVQAKMFEENVPTTHYTTSIIHVHVFCRYALVQEFSFSSAVMKLWWRG